VKQTVKFIGTWYRKWIIRGQCKRRKGKVLVKRQKLAVIRQIISGTRIYSMVAVEYLMFSPHMHTNRGLD
jgi:hypothetical protein